MQIKFIKDTTYKNNLMKGGTNRSKMVYDNGFKFNKGYGSINFQDAL